MFPSSCQSNRWGTRSRVLNVNTDPGSTVCVESPRKAVKKTAGLESESGVGGCSYLVHFGGKGQGKKLKLEDFRERKRKKPFLTLPFNHLIFSGVRVFTKISF